MNQESAAEAENGGQDEAFPADYFQPKDMTTIIEEMTATGDLTETDNSMAIHSVDNESNSSTSKI